WWRPDLRAVMAPLTRRPGTPTMAPRRPVSWPGPRCPAPRKPRSQHTPVGHHAMITGFLLPERKMYRQAGALWDAPAGKWPLASGKRPHPEDRRRARLPHAGAAGEASVRSGRPVTTWQLVMAISRKVDKDAGYQGGHPLMPAVIPAKWRGPVLAS